MVSRAREAEDEGALYLVVNASRKAIDDDFIRARLPSDVRLIAEEHRALLALQGPRAETVMARHCPGTVALSFMGVTRADFDGVPCHVSRSGYTGEDGFEISVPEDDAERVARALLAEPEVLPIGLGARDSLRLEAGLPLYGHDIDETTSPVEAALAWAIGKRRKLAKDFPGATRIVDELFSGTKRRRVGLRPQDKAPAREGTEILDPAGQWIGAVTSGGFGPSAAGPIAMGYVDSAFAGDGAEIALKIRGSARPARISPMPFVPHRYKRVT
jgi:aminomethyltransferase